MRRALSRSAGTVTPTALRHRGWVLLLGVALPMALAGQVADPVPGHDSLVVRSRVLAESRRINVHLPAGYVAGSERYPVLYMPDGGIDEDFPHVVNTLDSLVRLGEARPFIVVGIPNTERRRDLTGPTTLASDSSIAPRVGGSAAFRSFIRDELMPAIRARYRTAEETAIVGESLAGLFVVETFLLEPALFRRAIAISPSLWWNDRALLREAPVRIAASNGLTRTLFLTSADEENIAPETAELARTLYARAPAALTWQYIPRPDQRHGTIFRAMAPEAFKTALKQ